MNTITIKLQFSEKDLEDSFLENIDYYCFDEEVEIPFEKYKIQNGDSLDIAFEKILSAFDDLDDGLIDENELELLQLVKSAMEKASDYYEGNQSGDQMVEYAKIRVTGYSNDKTVEEKFFDLPNWLYEWS
jgi:hypothetical protein